MSPISDSLVSGAQGMPCNGICVVMEGRVSALDLTCLGSKDRVLGPGEWFGVDCSTDVRTARESVIVSREICVFVFEVHFPSSNGRGTPQRHLKPLEIATQNFSEAVNEHGDRKSARPSLFHRTFEKAVLHSILQRIFGAASFVVD
jgi:hypothetical protein